MPQSQENVKVQNVYFEMINNPANAEVFREIMKKPFPAKIGYWVLKAITKIQSESKAYFAARQNLIMRCAELDEKGNVKVLPNGNVAAWDKEKDGQATFTKEHAELLQIEVDLGIKYIEANLDDLDGVNLSPLQWTLMPFLKVKEPSIGE